MSVSAKKHGDFAALAKNYSKYRPKYSETILTALLRMVDKPESEIDFVDVGAGTGIWTRMVAKRGCRSVTAIEPNEEMLSFGEKDSDGFTISWKKGSGERTGLENECCDFLTMASSFHWVDFEKGTREFHRILRKGGIFVALWNPRLIEANPLLVEIENKLYEMAPHIKRVSSGRSGMTKILTEKLVESPFFEDVVYIEGRHTIKQTPEQYIGVWWSVNDVRVQAGEKVFSMFMDFVENHTKNLNYIKATYLTKAWCAKKCNFLS